METVSVIRSLKIQARIIGALLLREILTRFGRHNIGFMWIFVEPMLFTTGVLLVWTILRSHRVQLPLIPFTVSGYATVLLWRTMVNRCGNALEPNRTLLHHRNVRIFDFFASRLILDAAGASLSFPFLSIGLITMGLMEFPDDILKMIIAWLLLVWFSFSLGLIIGAWSVFSEAVERVWHIVSYLFLPMSGAFFMVDWLPQRVQKVAVWIPVVNCTELLREGYFGVSVKAHYSIPFIIVSNSVMTLFGLYLIRYVSDRVEGE